MIYYCQAGFQPSAFLLISPPEHLLYRPVQAVVWLRILTADDDGAFDLLALVLGAEAVAAVERLTAVVRRSAD